MTIHEAVRALRLALGDTQQQFAQRLNMAISTVVRYELTRPPKGKVLARFDALAREIERPELAYVFAKALAEELGTPPPPDLANHDLQMAKFTRVDDPEDYFALACIRANPGWYARECKEWERLRLRPVKAVNQVADRLKLSVHPCMTILELYFRGHSPERIAELVLRQPMSAGRSTSVPEGLYPGVVKDVLREFEAVSTRKGKPQ